MVESKVTKSAYRHVTIASPFSIVNISWVEKKLSSFSFSSIQVYTLENSYTLLVDRKGKVKSLSLSFSLFLFWKLNFWLMQLLSFSLTSDIELCFFVLIHSFAICFEWKMNLKKCKKLFEFAIIHQIKDKK